MKYEKVTLSFNKDVLPEFIAQLEKLNGFLIAHIKDKNDRHEEFSMLYELIELLKEKLKEKQDNVVLKQPEVTQPELGVKCRLCAYTADSQIKLDQHYLSFHA